MRLAHIYDHTYYQHQGQYYSSGAFSSSSWDRYLSAFEELTVVANLAPDERPVDQLNLASAARVQFAFMPNARKLRQFSRYWLRDHRQLEALIVAHDAIAVRLPSELGLFALRIARKLNKPYAIEVVGCTWDAYWNHGSLQGKLLAPLSFVRMKAAIRKASFVSYVTQEFLQRRYPTHGHTNYCSNVDISVKEGTGQQTNRLKRIAQPSTPLRIGLIGSFAVRYKGHADLLRALAVVQTDHPALQIVLVGPGPINWVEQLAAGLGLAPQLSILGKLPRGQAILDYLDSLDLYVHPSKQEGLPRTVIEAMSRGLPVLASSVAGIPELLPQQYLHRPGDYRELARQLRAYFSSSVEERQAMSMENFQRAQDYDLPLLTERRRLFWRTFAEHVYNH